MIGSLGNVIFVVNIKFPLATYRTIVHVPLTEEVCCLNSAFPPLSKVALLTGWKDTTIYLSFNNRLVEKELKNPCEHRVL